MLEPADGDRCFTDRTGGRVAMALVATCLGFPRIGADRELKKALEAFWAGTIIGRRARGGWARAPRPALVGDEGSRHASTCRPTTSRSTTTCSTPRSCSARSRRATRRWPTRWRATSRWRAACKIRRPGSTSPALEMTKWFDTNYHYIVPELEPGQSFALDPSRILREIAEARAAGVEPRPVVVGPVTFLLLAKLARRTRRPPLDAARAGPSRAGLRGAARRLLRRPGRVGPARRALPGPRSRRPLDRGLPARLPAPDVVRRSGRKIVLATLLRRAGDNLDARGRRSAARRLHVDLVRAPEQLDAVLARLARAARALARASSTDATSGAPTSTLRMPPIARAVGDAGPRPGARGAPRARCCTSRSTRSSRPARRRAQVVARVRPPEARRDRRAGRRRRRRSSAFIPCVSRPRAPRSPAGAPRRGRTTAPCATELAAVTDEMLRRSIAVRRARIASSASASACRSLPTTTIGSFPQTARGARGARRLARRPHDRRRRTKLPARTRPRRCVAEQEAIGLDVLVHGEFERTDMVEYFGEQLEGFAFTEQRLGAELRLALREAADPLRRCRAAARR